MGYHIPPLYLNPHLAPDTMLDSAVDMVNEIFTGQLL